MAAQAVGSAVLRCWRVRLSGCWLPWERGRGRGLLALPAREPPPPLPAPLPQMARLVGQKRAREMWFLARLYDAQQALAMGLVNTVVPLQQLEAETLAWWVGWGGVWRGGVGGGRSHS